MAGGRFPFAMVWLSVLFIALFMLMGVLCDEKTKAVNEEPIDEEKITYAKGSLCGYCDHCKFCKLCDADCPCETSPTKPNCHMCKYCKWCYLCKLCDTACKPGGYVDTITSSIVNAIPWSSFNKEEIDKDIISVKSYIDKSKDEL